MKVLIAGGGIAGPAAAIALNKAGIDSALYEAYPPSSGEGAFVTIAANGQDALRAIDADQAVLDTSFPAARLRLLAPDGTQLADLPLGRDHPSPRTITRAGLSQALLEETVRRGIPVQYGMRITAAAASSSGGFRVSFADGSHADGDLLIGADGIRSVVRGLIDPDAPAPRYSGLTIACGYAEHSPVTTEVGSYDMCYGHQAFFGHTTGADGRDWWFARVPSPELSPADLAMPDEFWRARIAEAFAADGTPAADIVRATGGRITVTSAYDIPSLPTWHSNSMIVIGDAAHATSPSTAQGASMALEDAVVLAQCLRDLPSLPEALAGFEGLRRERVERIVASGASNGNPSPPAPGPRSGNPPTWLFGHHIDWDETVRVPGSATASIDVRGR
jgi:2-polyprenyl-6-methoxyphenol hydroxylase-like FAD-dependent oxidoreductase